MAGFAAGSFRIEDLVGAATDAVNPALQLQLQAGDAVVFGPGGRLDDAASVPLRIADRAWCC